MRKPENRDKMRVALDAIVAFYGKRDGKMVAELLEEEARKAKELELRRELKRQRVKDEG